MNVKYAMTFHGGGPVWVPVQNGPSVVSARVQTDPLIGPALKQALDRSGLMVRNDATRLVPVDRARLKGSIKNVLDARPVPLYTTVGTNVEYAEYVHEGRAPGGKMPPPEALRVWARRHGFKVGAKAKVSRRTGRTVIEPALYMLARAIARRGIAPKRYLTDALAHNVSNIRAEFAHAAKMIEAAWRTS